MTPEAERSGSSSSIVEWYRIFLRLAGILGALSIVVLAFVIAPLPLRLVTISLAVLITATTLVFVGRIGRSAENACRDAILGVIFVTLISIICLSLWALLIEHTWLPVHGVAYPVPKDVPAQGMPHGEETEHNVPAQARPEEEEAERDNAEQ